MNPPFLTPRLKVCAPEIVSDTVGCCDADERNDGTRLGLGDGDDCSAIELDEFDTVGPNVLSMT